VEQQDKLVEQQGQIITLLSAITPVNITAKAPVCPTTVTTALSIPTFSSAAAVSQIPPVPVPSPPVVSKPVADEPTLLDLLDTTDDDLDFLDSPSWLSSDNKEPFQLPYHPPLNQSASPVEMWTTPLAATNVPSLQLSSNQPWQYPTPPTVTTSARQNVNHLPLHSAPTTTSFIQNNLRLPPLPSAPPTAATSSRQNDNYVPPPLPFNTPPKLKPVDQVMREYPGESLSDLRKLAGALARDAIFGRDALRQSSLSGRNKKGQPSTETPLDVEKLDYIKTMVRSRIPNTSGIHFEAVWDKCRSTISKACQLLRDKDKKNLFK